MFFTWTYGNPVPYRTTLSIFEDSQVAGTFPVGVLQKWIA